MQDRVLTRDEVRLLLSVMDLHDCDAVIDWTNRTITVLSEVKVNPKVQLSTGPMTYQDKLHVIK